MRRALSLFSLLIVSCSTTPRHEPVHELTLADEVRLLREIQPAIRKDFPAVRDAALQTYVSDLGTRIVEANRAEIGPYSYTFIVVESPMVNAFALPAGAIYITKPLLGVVDSEAELAGVLGHEIAHVVARHTSQRIAEAQASREKSWIYGGTGAAAGAAVGLGAGSLFCGPLSSECLTGAAMVGGVAGAQGGLIVQRHRYLAQTRANESTADRIGFNLAVKAGYSAARVGDFFLRVVSEKTNSIYSDVSSTHPLGVDRKSAISDLVLGAVAGGQVTSPAFEQMRARL